MLKPAKLKVAPRQRALNAQRDAVKRLKRPAVSKAWTPDTLRPSNNAVNRLEVSDVRLAGSLNLSPMVVVEGGLAAAIAATKALNPQKTKVRFAPVEIDASTLKRDNERLERTLEVLTAGMEKQGFSVETRPSRGQGLWEYMHQTPAPELWSKDNWPVAPVLVVKNFHEYLNDLPEEALRTPRQLAVFDVAANKLPPYVAGREKEFDLSRNAMRVIFSIDGPLTESAVSALQRYTGTRTIFQVA